MKFLSKSTPIITLALSTTFSFYEAPATAFNLTQNNNPSSLITNLLGDTTGLSNFTVELTGDGRAFGIFENDPFSLGLGVALSTGKVTDLAGVNTDDGDFLSLGNINDLSRDFGVPGASGDSISMQIDFFADDTKEQLFFQYVFGSEEFVEFGGSQFNDSFSLTLNGRNLARLSDEETVININNLVPKPNGIYHPDFIYNPVGTGLASDITKLDGYTIPLLFKGDLIQNATNTLVINVKDEKDGILDSAVFIRAGTLGTIEPSPITNGGSGDGDGSGSGDGSGDGDGIVHPVPEPTTTLLISALTLGGGSFFKHKSTKKSQNF